MKRFSENRERDFNTLTVPKPKKRGNRWTLMLVGDRGKVISVKHFKGLAITSTFLFGIITVLAASLYFLYNAKVDENKRLQYALEDSRLKVTSLRGEKEQLMVGLVLAESKIKASLAETTAKPIKPAPATSQDKSASATIQPKAEDDINVTETVEETSAPEPTSDSEVATAAADISVKSQRDAELQVVDIENLEVLNAPENQRLKVTFKLKKTDPGIETISGRAFVILKQDTIDQKKWLTIPSVTLDAGKPSRVRRGQYFSIARFKSMKFERGYTADPNRFQHITIFVYAEDGKLLLEKEAPIVVRNMPLAPT